MKERWDQERTRILGCWVTDGERSLGGGEQEERFGHVRRRHGGVCTVFTGID